MTFTFDNRGYLQPNKGIESTLDEFKDVFVTRASFAERRQRIYENFEEFLSQLPSAIGSSFEIWLNGSFVNPMSRPGDLDIVIWINYFRWEESLAMRKAWRAYFGEHKYKLDVYFERILPESHIDWSDYEYQMKYWTFLFTRSKKHRRTKQSYAKGFIILRYGRDSQ